MEQDILSLNGLVTLAETIPLHLVDFAVDPGIDTRY